MRFILIACFVLAGTAYCQQGQIDDKTREALNQELDRLESLIKSEQEKIAAIQEKATRDGRQLNPLEKLAIKVSNAVLGELAKEIQQVRSKLGDSTVARRKRSILQVVGNILKNVGAGTADSVKDALKKELDQLTQRIKQIEEQVTALENKKKKDGTLNPIEQAILDGARLLLAQLEQRVEDINKRLGDSIAATAGEADDRKKQLQKELEQLDTIIKSTQEKIAALLEKKTRNPIEEKILKAAQTLLAQLEKQVQDVQKRLDESQAARIKRSILDDLKKAATGVSDKIKDALKAELEKLEQAIQQIEGQIEELIKNGNRSDEENQVLQKLEDLLKQLEQRVEDVKQRLGESTQ